MIFKQLFEPNSSSYTYLLGCRDSGLAVLIDPVCNGQVNLDSPLGCQPPLSGFQKLLFVLIG